MNWEVRTMKLKVSFCNKTVLRTDITRFAPVWGTYVLGLAMLVLLQIQPIDTDEQKGSWSGASSSSAGTVLPSTGCTPWWWCRPCLGIC